MRPVHVEVAHLCVVAIGENATLGISDDDLEAVGEVRLVVVVPHVDEVHVNRILRLLPLDLTNCPDVRVLPVACDLVVLRRGEPGGGPVDDVTAKGDLAFRVDVEELVRVSVEVKGPWIRLVAHCNGVGGTVHIPACAALVGPCHFVGSKAAQSRRRHHGGVGLVGLHPAAARVVLGNFLETKLLELFPLACKAVLVLAEHRQVAHFIELFPLANHRPLVAGHVQDRFFKRIVAVQDLLGSA